MKSNNKKNKDWKEGRTYLEVAMAWLYNYPKKSKSAWRGVKEFASFLDAVEKLTSKP